MPAASLRQAAAAILAVAVLAAAALRATPAPAAPDDRLNIVVILTDDQSFDTFPSHPPALPWLQSQVEDPDGHWLWFPNAFIQTPLCCPSRATILSGRDSRHTHVRTNDDGARFDETQTIATWLHGAGYFTGLDRQVPQPVPVRARPVHPARVGPLGRQAQHGRDHDVLELRVRGPRGRDADERRSRHVRHRPVRRPRRRLPADGAERPAVLPVLRDERAASSVDPADPSRGRVRGRCARRRRRAWSSATSRTSRGGCGSSGRSTPSSAPGSSRTGGMRRRRCSGWTMRSSGSSSSSERAASWSTR